MVLSPIKNRHNQEKQKRSVLTITKDASRTRLRRIRAKGAQRAQRTMAKKKKTPRGPDLTVVAAAVRGGYLRQQMIERGFLSNRKFSDHIIDLFPKAGVSEGTIRNALLSKEITFGHTFQMAYALGISDPSDLLIDPTAFDFKDYKNARYDPKSCFYPQVALSADPAEVEERIREIVKDFADKVLSVLLGVVTVRKANSTVVIFQVPKDGNISALSPHWPESSRMSNLPHYELAGITVMNVKDWKDLSIGEQAYFPEPRDRGEEYHDVLKEWAEAQGPLAVYYFSLLDPAEQRLVWLFYQRGIPSLTQLMNVPLDIAQDVAKLIKTSIELRRPWNVEWPPLPEDRVPAESPFQPVAP